jgi:hypothetical protein
MAKRLGMRVAGILLALATIVPLGSPASAISVELAKKCRQLALSAHPPPLIPGGKPYAQAERDFFSDCVAKNGQMSGTGTQDTDPSKKPPGQK